MGIFFGSGYLVRWVESSLTFVNDELCNVEQLCLNQKSITAMRRFASPLLHQKVPMKATLKLTFNRTIQSLWLVLNQFQLMLRAINSICAISTPSFKANSECVVSHLHIFAYLDIFFFFCPFEGNCLNGHFPIIWHQIVSYLQIWFK